MQKGFGRMRICREFLIVLFLCACVESAFAQEPKPLSAVPPGSFQFHGSWTCTGSFGNGKTHRSTFTGSVILDGKWLELNEKDVEPATGYLAKYLIGYDAEQKRLVEFDANNFGAATYSSVEGWKDGVLTMTSPVVSDPGAPYAANRFIYSVVAKDSFTVDWQVSKSQALNWVSGDHLVCIRASHT
jgi:hypothetical protein